MTDTDGGRTWRDVRPTVFGVPAHPVEGDPLDRPQDESEVLVEWYDTSERFARPLGVASTSARERRLPSAGSWPKRPAARCG